MWQKCLSFGTIVLGLSLLGMMTSGCRIVPGQNQITENTPVASQPAVPRNLVERIDAFMMEQVNNGGNDLFYADIHRYVEDDVMIFITSNAGKPDATELSWEIADLIFNEAN